MSRPRAWVALILGLTVAAAALRLPQLERRPMHTDEAVHAVKFGPLLERGVYRYDRQEYHGPTLNYLTLIPAWLSSATQLTEVSETTLRIVPVFFGVLLVAMVLLVGSGLGWPAVAVSALLTAISPAMVYYSRYYIMELLLVCFTFGVILSGYRYARSRKLGWALSTGVFLGLMHATKETFVLALVAMLAALWLTLLLGRRRGGRGPLDVIKSIAPGHGLALVGAGLLVSALFYSSFLSHPQGILDSIYAYKSYFVRAGQNQLHLHPPLL
ncbi:MAG: TIGR03663 family protein [Candidatus Marinimicrobia bacterium]|nr:TIGR03663 family protein [Candidatus Neomarinimicrobiota bacterium]